jgi:hypothetical protein
VAYRLFVRAQHDSWPYVIGPRTAQAGSYLFVIVCDESGIGTNLTVRTDLGPPLLNKEPGDF